MSSAAKHLPSRLEQEEEFSCSIASANERAIRVFNFLSSLDVSKDDEYNKVTQFWKELKDLEEALDKERLSLTKEARDYVSSINANAKKVTDFFKEIGDIIKKKASERLLLEEKRKEELKLQFLENPSAEVDLSYALSSKTAVQGESASAWFETKRSVVVKDIKSVPARYLQIDEKLVLSDLKNGMLSIPGIEIVEEKVAKLRSK